MGLLGAHMSVAGGVHLAIERGDSLKCEAIQIFLQSSRTWKTSPLRDEEIVAFKKARATAKTVKSVVAHNSYLLNLTTDLSAMRLKSVAYFIELMERCEALGVDGMITHPGSHLGVGVERGIQNTANSLNEVLKATRGFTSKIILENTAGQGGCVGCTFDELRAIVSKTTEPERIHYCFDTQHAFAAGYDLRTPETYAATLAEFDEKLSLKKLVAFHVNDAMKEMGCRVDRHQAIGKGFLGKEAFRSLVNDHRFAKIPMCLETDPGDEMKNYRRELQLLRRLIA